MVNELNTYWDADGVLVWHKRKGVRYIVKKKIKNKEKKDFGIYCKHRPVKWRKRWEFFGSALWIFQITVPMHNLFHFFFQKNY
jgi:hypothetical protein